MYRNYSEMNRCTVLQITQNIKQNIGVLAAAHADHDHVIFLDQIVVGYRLTDIVTQSFLQLVEIIL